MFCLGLNTNLTSNPSFGISRVSGFSPTRKEFKDAFLRWHAYMNKWSAMLSFPHMDRKFQAPNTMLVLLTDVEGNIEHHQTYLDK